MYVGKDTSGNSVVKLRLMASPHSYRLPDAAGGDDEGKEEKDEEKRRDGGKVEVEEGKRRERGVVVVVVFNGDIGLIVVEVEEVVERNGVAVVEERK